MSMSDMPVWQEGEEFVNSFTHGVGAGLSLIGTVMLIESAKRSHNNYKLAGNIIFGLSMVTLYTVSCIYHGLSDGPNKRFMRYVDHCSVFLMIAGTYSPLTLTVLKNHGGLIIFSLIWTIAVFGCFSKIFFFDLVYPYSIHMFIAMGWIIAFSAKSLVKSMSRKGLFYLVLGGVLYTMGTYFYQYDQEITWYHAIFHFFILGGTLCHFICILYYS
ncbi:hypothetical protein M9Y10_032647 [Tritrichomonas musculus]|uniref:Hemolysin-3 n=1 Tax=Tritrichomonas musculus TaxID=1915356 RepID=A0ABR2GXD2_9EUKA